MGLAGVAGTWCIGRLLRTRLFSILIRSRWSWRRRWSC